MPSDKNVLLDVLLARSVTGESPKKDKAAPRKSRGAGGAITPSSSRKSENIAIRE